MNQETRQALAIEELEQRLEMSAVPILPGEDGEETLKKCNTTTTIEF